MKTKQETLFNKQPPTNATEPEKAVKAAKVKERAERLLQDVEVGTVRKGKTEAFVCTNCGRNLPADPEVFEENITEEEIQQIEEMYCPDCCGWFMIPVEGPTFGGGYIVATGETIPASFPKMDSKKKQKVKKDERKEEVGSGL